MENRHKKNWKPFAIATGVLAAAFLIVFVISRFIDRNDFNVISEENEETEIQIESIPPESEPLESNTADMAKTEQTTETVSEELPKNYDNTMRFDRFDPDDEGYGEQQIGNLVIRYLKKDATAGRGEAAGAEVDAVSFHDGNVNDMRGYIFAVEALDTNTEVSTFDDAQNCVGEYVPDGSGISTKWEETGNFFVQKALGYDNSAKASFLYHTIVPKYGKYDGNIYSIVYVMDEKRVIKKTSYQSIADSVSEYIPDSSFLAETYDEICDELEDVLQNKSATGDSMGGVNELREAADAYYEDVYGVSKEEYEKLSEEEQMDLYWRYMDPIGYRHSHPDTAAPESSGTEKAMESGQEN